MIYILHDFKELKNGIEILVGTTVLNYELKQSKFSLDQELKNHSSNLNFAAVYYKKYKKVQIKCW